MNPTNTNSIFLLSDETLLSLPFPSEIAQQAEAVRDRIFDTILERIMA